MIEQVDAYLCELSRAAQPIEILTLKVGGSPVLLGEIDWPVCGTCEQPMDFLAQIPLHEPIAFLDHYAVAYVFMCSGKSSARPWVQCKPWDAFAGANRVVLQSGQGKNIVPTPSPTYPDYSINLQKVTEPMIDTSDYSTDEDLRAAVSESTKLGGVPAWLQNNDTPRCPKCGERMRFVAQLNAELDGPLPADPSKWSNEKYKFLEFGDDGLGYLFICDKERSTHGAAFLWQTT